MLPQPSVVYAATNDAISYDESSKTVTISDDCTTDEIYAFMHQDSQDSSSGTGKDATTLHFAGTSVIKTLQYDPTSGSEPDVSDGPFAMTQLENITADSGAQVSFVGKDNATPPTLMGFFALCGSLSSIDGLSSWDLSKVEGANCMHGLFAACSELTSLDGLSAWNVSDVSGDYCMYAMFASCSALTSLDGLSAWNVGNVSGKNCMSSMFQGCSSLTSLDGLSAWDVGNVRGDSCMQYMFASCTNLASLDGLSAWDVSRVSGDYCMSGMFYDCSSLTSLDGLSAWNVSNVGDDYCMFTMFYNCSNLISLDAIASWNIDKATASAYGVDQMFSNCNNIASITLGGANGFKLCNDNHNDMSLPSSANWWPVDNTSAMAGISTANLVLESKQDPPSSLRWQRCITGSENPMKTVSSFNVHWPQTNADKEELIYNGLFQTLGTKDNKVQVTATIDGQTEPVTLTEGADFYVVYKDADGTDTTAIKDAGDYSARIVLRGAYTGQDSESVEVTMQQLDLASDAYSLAVYTAPNRFPATGTAHTPKTMVRLYLRDDKNPQDPTELIPIYCYLVENTDKRPAGDYIVEYANNIDPGTADATVQGVTPAGLSSSNLEGTSTAHFRITGDYIVTFDSNGGSAVDAQTVAEGSTAKEPDSPTREGYSFLYWCKDEALTDEFDFSTPITADITLYAKWEETPEPTPPGPEPTPTDTVTLTFRTDEGSWNGIVETALTGVPDAVIIPPSYPYTDAARTCIGWFDEQGNQIISGVTTFAEVTGIVTARFVDTPGWHQNAVGWWYVYDLNNNYYTNCWALINSAWFYFNDAGYCLEYMWGYINGEWYFFGWGGYLQTGWQWLGSSWYFLDRNTGAMKCGWVHDGVWYYCDADLGGAMYDNCWAYINGYWYGFNEGGSMTQGWSWSYAYDGWFYLEPYTGVMQTGWQYIGGHWYYFYDNGLMAANTYVGNYRLGSDGAMW